MNLTVSRGKKRIKSQGRQDGPGTTSFRQNFRDWQPPYDPFVNVHEAVISHHQPSSTGPDYQQEINECAVGRSLETMCLPLTECAVWYDLLTNSAHDKACKMDKGGLGACCPDIPLNGNDVTAHRFCYWFHSFSVPFQEEEGRSGRFEWKQGFTSRSMRLLSVRLIA